MKISVEDFQDIFCKFLESHSLDSNDNLEVINEAKRKEIDDLFEKYLIEESRSELTRLRESNDLESDEEMLSRVTDDMENIDFSENFGDTSHLGSFMEEMDEEVPADIDVDSDSESVDDDEISSDDSGLSDEDDDLGEPGEDEEFVPDEEV